MAAVVQRQAGRGPELKAGKGHRDRHRVPVVCTFGAGEPTSPAKLEGGVAKAKAAMEVQTPSLRCEGKALEFQSTSGVKNYWGN